MMLNRCTKYMYKYAHNSMAMLVQATLMSTL